MIKTMQPLFKQTPHVEETAEETKVANTLTLEERETVILFDEFNKTASVDTL